MGAGDGGWGEGVPAGCGMACGGLLGIRRLGAEWGSASGMGETRRMDREAKGTARLHRRSAGLATPAGPRLRTWV